MTEDKARELAKRFGVRMCDENGNTHNEELYCIGLDDIMEMAKALAQPEQEQNLKLMPREATPEMLKAMDECSTEGYDERLYEGHAGSVYMAAWDAFYGQHCYCGDITNLGVIHRDDGPCHYPDHKEPEQEPVAWMEGESVYWHTNPSLNDWIRANGTPLYTTPPQRPSRSDIKPLTDTERDSMVDSYDSGLMEKFWYLKGIDDTEAAHGIRPTDFKE